MNNVSHVEWATTDLDGLRDFMQGMFGWEFTAMGPAYYFARSGELGIGLLLNPKAVVAGGTPNVYISVASIDDAFARAESLGGGMANPKIEIPGSGWYGFVKAADGNLVGLHQHAPE